MGSSVSMFILNSSKLQIPISSYDLANALRLYTMKSFILFVTSGPSVTWSGILVSVPVVSHVSTSSGSSFSWLSSLRLVGLAVLVLLVQSRVKVGPPRIEPFRVLGVYLPQSRPNSVSVSLFGIMTKVSRQRLFCVTTS